MIRWQIEMVKKLKFLKFDLETCIQTKQQLERQWMQRQNIFVRVMNNVDVSFKNTCKWRKFIFVVRLIDKNIWAYFFTESYHFKITKIFFQFKYFLNCCNVNVAILNTIKMLTSKNLFWSFWVLYCQTSS